MSVTLSVWATPAPTVRLDVTALPAGSARLVVTRSWDGVTELVRQQVIPSGTAALVDDFVPPIGRPVSYTVQALSSAGVALDTQVSGSITVPAPADLWDAWVLDELDPARAIQIVMMAGTNDQVSYESSGSVSVPASGALASWLGGGRQRSRPYDIKVHSMAEGDAFERLISRGGVLTFRCGPALRHLTGIVRLGCRSIVEVPHAYLPTARWRAEGPEVQPAAWPSTVPLVTWAQRRATLTAGTTWAQRRAATSPGTWLQRRRGS